MELKEFVSETLKQVSEAIKENPSTYTQSKSSQDLLRNIDMFNHKDGFVTHVDFDIAVSETSAQNGGAKLSVVGLGSIGGDKKESVGSVSRIKFRVPIQLNAK
jgi:hypothetical protein